MAVAVVAAVVAVSVATFGVGAVAMAALGGAVLGAAASVAGTSVSDRINHTQTSLKGYLINAGIGAVAGAFCGAVFGPLGSGAAASLLPVTTRQVPTNMATMMFAVGSESYISESLTQMWNGKVDPAAAWRAFGFGALTGGAFGVAGSLIQKSWLAIQKNFIPHLSRLANNGGNLAKRMIASAKNAAVKFAQQAKETLADEGRRALHYLDPKNYIKVVDTGFNRIRTTSPIMLWTLCIGISSIIIRESKIFG